MIQKHVEDAYQSLKLALADEPTLPPPPPPGSFRLSAKSLERLQGVHPDLVAVVQFAIRCSVVDFGIPRTGGVRDRALQSKLVNAGKSGTMRSRHLSGHAVDIFAFVDGEATWNPTHILKIHEAFEAASNALGVPLRWGGDWDGDGDIREPGENDLVHHELPKSVYGTDSAIRSSRAASFLGSIS